MRSTFNLEIMPFLCTFCCFCRCDCFHQAVTPLTMEQNSKNLCRWTNILNKNGQRKQTKHIQRTSMWNVCDNETKDQAASSKTLWLLTSWHPPNTTTNNKNDSNFWLIRPSNLSNMNWEKHTYDLILWDIDSDWHT